jgi:hypothetical protein
MITRALTKVFSHPAYIALALIAGTSVLLFALWFPNLGLIASVVASPDASLVEKVLLPITLLGSIATNFSFFSASYTVAVSLLFGVYVALMVYFLRRRIKAASGGTVTGTLGILSGVIGIGCAACGSIAASTILSLIGVSGVVALLPLGGSEFGIIGIILFLLAIRTLAKQIETPAVCRI